MTDTLTTAFLSLRNPIEAIVAVDQDNGYSKAGMIPWHIPEDFKWFRACTRECIGLMGSGTYKDIANRLSDKAAQSILPGRDIYVLSSSMEPVLNATVVRSFEEFMELAIVKVQSTPDRKIMFFGGKEVYELGLPFCHRVHITRIPLKFGCDRFFPMEYVERDLRLTYSDQLPTCTMETWSNV